MSTKGLTHENQSNNQIEWYTPKWIFDALDAEFDLDPCHPIIGLNYIPVKNIYNIHHDGLNKEWHGNVWMNPPYGKEIPKWLEKLYNHGNGIALVFSRTDTEWFHQYCAKSDAILFFNGRIKFIDGIGNKSGTPGCGSILVAFGKHNRTILERMQNYGLLVYP